MFFSRKFRPTPLFPSRRRADQKRRSIRFGTGLTLEGLEDRRVMTYLAPASFAVGVNPGGVAISDFNKDSIPDMAVANSGLAGTVRIFQGTGGGAFNLGVDYSAGSFANDVKAGDFDGDGSTDLAVVGSNSTLTILRNNGDGSFAPPVTYAAGLGSHSLNVGDFNKDGKLDVVTMNASTTSLFLGNGDGSLQTHADSLIPGNSTNTVVGDFNNDGNLDVATSNTASVGTITVLRGHGDGSFDPASSYPAFSAPVYLASGDYNEDGYDDFSVANSYAASSMSVILSNGDGTYAPPKTYNINQTGYEIESGDFNGDGHDDFAVRGSSQYMVEYGKGDGSFYPLVAYSVPAGRFEMGSSGDLDGDGAVDFAYPSTSGVTVVRNAHDDASNVAGAVSFQVALPASATAGAAVPMTISALDAGGNVATGFLGTVYVTSNDPGSVSTYAYTFTAADNGVHTFTGTVRLATLGTQSITVAAPYLASTTRSITVTPAVSRFTVSAPTASAAGDSFTVTVSAIDSLGSVGTGYGGTVRFSSSDPLAGLPSDYTFTADDAGVHTFNVSLKSAGSRYVGVTESGSAVAGRGLRERLRRGRDRLHPRRRGRGHRLRPPGHRHRPRRLRQHGDRLQRHDPRDQLGRRRDPAGRRRAGERRGDRECDADDRRHPDDHRDRHRQRRPDRQRLQRRHPRRSRSCSRSRATRRASPARPTPSPSGSSIASARPPPDTPGRSTSPAPTPQAGLPSYYTFTAADAGVHTFSAALKTAGTQSISAYDTTGTLAGQPARDRRHAGRLRLVPAVRPLRHRQQGPHVDDGRGQHPADRQGHRRLWQPGRRLQGQGALHQHRRPGRPPDRLQLQRRRRRGPHLQPRPQDRHRERGGRVLQRGPTPPARPP